jgi:hypothetical protein
VPAARGRDRRSQRRAKPIAPKSGAAA